MRNFNVILCVFLLYIFLEVLMLRINKSKGDRNYLGREIMRILFAFYMICLISDIIIAPSYNDASETFKCGANMINLVPFDEYIKSADVANSNIMMDMIKNFFLFVPMIIYMCFYNRNVRSIGSTIIVSILFSMIIQGVELIQNVCAGANRSITITFVILNILGAILGNFIFRLLYKTKMNIVVY